MNNSPVLKLQDMASSSSTDVGELLSRAKMISVKLGLKDISEWIEHELNGYPSIDVLPSYRILKHAPIKAFNPYIGWIPTQLGNLENSNAELYEMLTTVHINNPVSMLTEFSKSDTILHSDLPPFMATLLQKTSGLDFRVAWCINPAQIINVFSNIKSRILDWALLLESKNILGEGLLFSSEEKNEAIGMTVNNTNNFHGNVNNAGTIGAGNTGDIHQQNTITAGDFDSLERQLKDYGVEDNDISELKEIVQNSPNPISSDNFGDKIGGWIGNMIGKAYSGSLKIAGTAAPALLTNAICHYYGIPV
ncbi:abortive phage resistance protein [Xenorhabdus sp. DI]|uniref:AbiTii domain-containing protein n=1 Tax=Xenorhabdus doucetiae TaxID=351671 RepID=UPI0019AC28C1|nr:MULTISPECIES: abortive phage resistance protein [unclassified Xenorhabdus]MBD2784825.1 abortive phage resistance protein [Xenorhabdus sp. 3]MBD2788054.1 abortive phage resistance protein [Xenorhabdus sp. DI]